MQLFKYVPAARIDILKNELIRFSPSAALNDPWEMKPYLEQLLSDASLDELAEAQRKNRNPIAQDNEDFALYWKIQRKSNPRLSKKEARRMYEAFKQRPDMAVKLKLVEPTAERLARQHFRAVREPMLKEEFFKITNEWGVLSLTEEPNNILMWAHYCDCHKGFIFELDPQHSFFTVLKKHAPVQTIRPIVYSDKLPHIKEHTDFFKDNTGLDALLFTKDKRWAYEKEWRMIADYRDATKVVPVEGADDIWLFHLPADCIKRVVLGCSMPLHTKQEFTDFLKTDARYKHVRLQEAVRVAHSYDFEFKNI